MTNTKVSEELMTLLNDATDREMKVSMQYMMRHSLYSGGGSAVENDSLSSGTDKFVTNHYLLTM